MLVVLPLPVGPVKKSSPCGLSSMRVSCARTDSGRRRSSKRGPLLPRPASRITAFSPCWVGSSEMRTSALPSGVGRVNCPACGLSLT